MGRGVHSDLFLFRFLLWSRRREATLEVLFAYATALFLLFAPSSAPLSQHGAAIATVTRPDQIVRSTRVLHVKYTRYPRPDFRCAH